MSASSIITATATSGFSAGANETNQAYGGTLSMPLCAVPVLPATSTPGIAAGLAVPLSTVATSSSVSSSAVDDEIACENSSCSVCSRVSYSADCTSSTR